MRPKTAFAAILTRLHAPLVVDEVELPTALTFGQVLVKIFYTTICGSQLNEIEGVKGPDKFLPHLLGHEASGLVLAVGEGVTRVKMGDRVVLHWRKASGLEANSAVYRWGKRRVNAGKVTTFQEYSVVSENRLTKIPDSFDAKLAPLLGCAVTTAFGVINNDAAVKIGQSVVCFGVGGVGLNVIQGARLVSAFPIVAVDIFDEKLKMAKKLGASHVINTKKVTNVLQAVYEIVGGEGADVVIDTTGNTRVIELCYTLTHPNGKTILVGVPKIGENVSIYTLPLHFNKVLKGSHGGASAPDIDIPRYIRLCEQGILTLEGIITHEFPLSKINAAIQKMRTTATGRIVIRMANT